MLLAALLVVGSLTLHSCADAPQYYCGAYARPLDPAGVVPGTISIGFTYLPHRSSDAPYAGTIVAAEGGPGYPSGAPASRDGYRTLFDPLLNSRDLLLMDDRGTGRSGAIDCEPLQRAPVMTLANVTRCGNELGARSDLYGSALAADDLAALMTALGIKDASFYGDSYGTFFVQVFAARHPDRVRSIVLDGAYPAIGLDAWYSSNGPTMRSAFDLVCRRFGTCAGLAGTSDDRIASLVRALREPHAPVTPSQLAMIMFSAGLNPLAYREVDAAARAYVDGRDAVPIERLARETQTYEEDNTLPPSELSQGLFAANSCSDNPQAYDMLLPPHERQTAWQGALRAKEHEQPDLYAPFTIAEFLGIPLDYSYVPLCQTWPVANAAHPAGQPIPTGTGMPDVPALVLTGDLDTITTPPDGDRAAALFRNHRRVIVENTGHVTAVGDRDRCASVIVRAFVNGETIDTACTTQIPPVRLVPNFARHVAEVPRPTPLTTRWNDRALRSAAAAVFAAADAFYRIQGYGMTHGPGLRGGSFTSTTTGAKLRIALHGAKWTDDLAVNGTLTFNEKDQHVSASLTAPGTALHAVWYARNSTEPVTITGTIGGDRIRATMPVP